MLKFVDIMEEIYAACLTYEPSLIDLLDFQKSDEPVWILGKKYNTQNEEELEKIQQDILSKLWFTYRKQFPAIGNTSFSSDSGWGCMHRCGQMMLAQTLIMRFLGREWQWETKCSHPMYLRILNYFNDTEDCKYSIHKIAVQGDILDKRIGQWFGPNTIAQVLKKLVSEDEGSDIAVHVALDNMVVKSEIRNVCKELGSKCRTFENKSTAIANNYNRNEESSESNLQSSNKVETELEESDFSPLLLVIPLRLGLSEIIPSYFEKLKATFSFKQSVGIVGGRTNHASYFIGYVGNELVYLDPHTTQFFSPEMDDETYHCSHAGRMNFKQLDPSIALCFYCENEDDFENWCTKSQNVLLQPETDALFEILEERPPMLPFVSLSSDTYDSDVACGITYPDDLNLKYTSDDEFELL